MAVLRGVRFTLVSLLLLFLLSTQPQPASSSRCILRYPRDTCFSLYTALNNTIRTERNVYELVQFFLPKTAFFTTQFVNILYSLTYSSNGTTGLPRCPGTYNGSVFVRPGVRTEFLQGWSSTGVFNIISPTDLSKIQLQLLNEILALFITPGTGIALPGRFSHGVSLEDGRDVQLNPNNYRVNLELNIDSFPCAPSVPLVLAVLEDLTTMVRLVTKPLKPHDYIY